MAYPNSARLASRARFVLPPFPATPTDIINRVLTSLVMTTFTEAEPKAPPVPLGLRKIPPYWYPYSTYAKERWIGREILEVVSTEFRDRSMEYYVCAVLFHSILANFVVEICIRLWCNHIEPSDS